MNLNYLFTDIKYRIFGKISNKPYLQSEQKQELIRKFSKSFDINCFVETGTYIGDMIWALKDDFSQIYSIELDKKLAKQAKERFSKYKHVKIVQGDSSNTLPKILDKNNEPIIFWLDSHYSGGITSKGKFNTSIRCELKLIIRRKNLKDIILIDDARLFNGKDDYPDIEELKKKLSGKNYCLKIKQDIIWYYPKKYEHR